MARVAIIGSGHVGLTTAACLAHLGHRVACADADRAKITLLRSGRIPIVEEGLAELVADGLASGRLVFHLDNLEATAEAEFILLCLPTPQSESGRADLSFVATVAREIGPHLSPGSVVVNKSTVPVGSAKLVEQTIARPDVRVVSNPEFLREGSAVHDFLHPSRIVIGADDDETALRVAGLFLRATAPVVVTDPVSAQTIKYASNAFLATKLSFVNAIAALCEAVGADARDVTAGMRLDPRIGGDFLSPGPGWGGSCLPKDTRALIRIAEDVGYDFKLLKGTIEANEAQHDHVVAKVARLAGGSLEGVRVGLWGLAFKAGTDDLRESPALAVAQRLLAAGARLRGFDPSLDHSSRELAAAGIELVKAPLDACVDANVLLVTTEWDEFRYQDFEAIGAAMRSRRVVDGRNVLDPEVLRRAGFCYEGIGVR